MGRKAGYKNGIKKCHICGISNDTVTTGKNDKLVCASCNRKTSIKFSSIHELNLQYYEQLRKHKGL